MLVIGDDGGGCLYYYDPDNKLGTGPFAMYFVSMGSLFFKDSVHVAASLTEMIEKIWSGAKFGDMLFRNK